MRRARSVNSTLVTPVASCFSAGAAALPPEGEPFAPWGGPAALIGVPPRLRLAPLRCPLRGSHSRLGAARRRSYDLGAEQIVQMQCTYQPGMVVDNQQLAHLGQRFHQLDAVDREPVRFDGARLAGHEALDASSSKVRDVREATAQIAVGEYP